MNPLNLIRTLVFVIILSLPLAQLHANIGDTEQQVLLANLGTAIDRDTIDERAKVIVFTTKETQYAVGILDGKVESEVFTKNDDSKPDKSFVLGVLHTYKEVWFPISCGEDCAAVMSDDAKLFAKIGPSQELRKKNVFWIFSDAWREFALSKKKSKFGPV